jgi:imidazolonepropionase-like amidohydrolase
MNTSHARTYRLDGEGVTPLAAGELRLRSRWEGGSLVAEGTDTSSQGGVRETLSLGAAGQQLVVAITRTSPGSEGTARTAKLVYERVERELPCTEWTTPCKDWSADTLAPPSLSTVTSAAPSLLAFVGARLLDGRGGPAIDDTTILVENGRIARLGPSSLVDVPQGATRLDLAGKTILPGLVNAHGHVGTTRGLDSSPAVYTEENVRAQLHLYARYGVTTVASLGGDGEAGIRVRDAQAKGQAGDREAGGARLLLAGPVVVADTPEGARKQVAALAASKVDLVKIRVDDNLGRTKKMAPEVYRAVIEEAHARGLRVAAHLYYLDDAKDLVRAGADLLGHSVRDLEVDEELIDLLRASGVCLSPTLTREVSTYVYASRPAFFDDPFFRRAADPEVLEQLADPERQRRVRESPDSAVYQRALETASANLLRLHRAGVPIAFGTDSGPPGRFQGYFEHLELLLMAAAGLSPHDVLVAATRDAARCLRRDDVGTLEPGKWADLLVLEADPLADLRNLQRIHSVWIGGRRVEDAVAGAAEGPASGSR